MLHWTKSNKNENSKRKGKVPKNIVFDNKTYLKQMLYWQSQKQILEEISGVNNKLASVNVIIASRVYQSSLEEFLETTIASLTGLYYL